MSNDLPTPSPLNEATTPRIGIANDRFVDSLVDELKRASAPSAEWQSELISEKTTHQLKQLVQSVLDDNQPPYDWNSSTLVPHGSIVFEDHLMRVLRSTTVTVPESNNGYQQLRNFIQPFADADTRYELKSVDVVHVAGSETATTRLLVSVLIVPQKSDAKIHRLQRNSQWKCTWKMGGPDEITLASIESERFEQIEDKSDARFTDVSEYVLTGTQLRKQIYAGLDFWRSRIDWRFGLDIIGPHGIAIGDVNQDGFDDVYYCDAGGLPNRLLIRQPDGTVKDHAAEAGVDFLEPTQSALILDLDNDADQDLVLACGRYVLLLANNGNGKFTLSSIQQFDSVIRSMSAADFDGNRFVDIYVCGYFSRTPDSGIGLGRPLPYHDANNGTPNHLLANSGQWNFRDVTKQVGLDVNNRRFSYAAAWSDYDDDGDLDLYVANDFGRNNLYRNDNGMFEDVAAASGVEDISAGMSAHWSDFDRDGDFDIFVGNMYSSAGKRIAHQLGFQASADGTVRRQFQRHARGNSLFRNDGSVFHDVSVESNVTMGRWAWSSNFVDLNNDGWDDMVVANGFVTSDSDTKDL